jgi:predicted transcriptional regulator
MSRPLASRPSIAKAQESSSSVVRKGGRPKAFEGETVKIALFLPPDLAGTLKAFAARRRLTPSLVVADWIQVAEVREALDRGRQDFERGDVVSHEEALRRLAKW